MKFEQPPAPSPEEMAKIAKERALSDAELLKGGAEYKFDEKGEKHLEVTDEQVAKASMLPYNLESPKTINEQRTQFIERQLKDAETFIAMQNFASEEAKAQAIEKFKSGIAETFDSIAAKQRAGLTSEDVKFLNEAENPHNFMSMSTEEKMRLYELRDKIKSAEAQIKQEQTQEQIERGIESAESFDALFGTIDMSGGLQGTHSFYKPEELKSIITKVRNGKLDLTYITKTNGLRMKVKELINQERGGEKSAEDYELGQVINAPASKEKGPVINWVVDEIFKDGQKFALKRNDGEPGYLILTKEALNNIKSQYNPEDNVQEKISGAKSFDELREIILDKENKFGELLHEDALVNNLSKVISSANEGNISAIIDIDYNIPMQIGIRKKVFGLLKEQGILTQIENKISDRIKEAKNMKDLFAVIDEMGGVVDNDRSEMYAPERAKALINAIKDDKDKLEYIPTNYGLRQKVEELSALEKVRKES